MGAIEFTDEQLGFLIPGHVKRMNANDCLDLRGDDAYEAFRDVRFGFTDGKPVCPYCGNDKTIYEWKRKKSRGARRGMNCASCGKQFSVTSKTAFKSRKLPFNSILAALAFSFRGSLSSIMELSEELDVNYRTAWLFSKKFRNFSGNIKPKTKDLYWPYRQAGAPDGGALINAVNAAVPNELPEQVRADVCQDLIVGVLAGEITEADLRENIRAYIRKHYNVSEPRLFDLSLDAPLKTGDGEGYFTDLISYQRWLGQTPAY